MKGRGKDGATKQKRNERQKGSRHVEKDAEERVTKQRKKRTAEGQQACGERRRRKSNKAEEETNGRRATGMWRKTQKKE